MFENWKTTAAGVGAILIALGSILNAVATGDFEGISGGIAALVAGVGLLAAGDAI